MLLDRKLLPWKRHLSSCQKKDGLAGKPGGIGSQVVGAACAKALGLGECGLLAELKKAFCEELREDELGRSLVSVAGAVRELSLGGEKWRGGERPRKPWKGVWTLSWGQGKPLGGSACVSVCVCVCVCVCARGLRFDAESSASLWAPVTNGILETEFWVK